MPKSQTVFICQSCGVEFPKWQGQCPQCGEWNSLVETVVPTQKTKTRAWGLKSTSTPQNLSQIKSEFKRIKTGIFEFDRVLGGGVVPGSITLLAGEPGIGKSTLLLQVAGAVSDASDTLPERMKKSPKEEGQALESSGLGSKISPEPSPKSLALGNSGAESVLYICGEESPEQIKSRARRLKIKGESLELLPETDVDVIIETVNRLISSTSPRHSEFISESVPRSKTLKQVQGDGGSAVKLLIIDSIQALTTEDLLGGAGSIGQVRECAERLRRIAKTSGVPIILVGHVTKAGGVAGPKVLEHLVDGVFTLEGDRFHGFRILRAAKNRFGSSFEVGVFEMGEKGLSEVKNPSALFLSERNSQASGSVVTATLEGTRPVLVEIQSLTVPSKFKYPRVASSGFSLKRLQLLAAVLEKSGGFNLKDKDIYVNVASGLKIFEPAVDLAVILALSSSILAKPLGPNLCVFGEVGLSGEVRSVAQAKRREAEARRLGFKKILAPPKVKTIKQALSEARIS